MCPICRKDGGRILHNTKYDYLSTIHISNKSQLCCGINGKPCTLSGSVAFNGMCFKHYHLKSNSDSDLDTSVKISSPHLCNFKYITKKGYCTSKGKEIYGGLCGVHKNKISTVSASVSASASASISISVSESASASASEPHTLTESNTLSISPTSIVEVI